MSPLEIISSFQRDSITKRKHSQGEAATFGT
jgi:hypothetical protein